MGNWVIFNQFSLSDKYIALQSAGCNNYIQSGGFTLETFYSNVDPRPCGYTILVPVLSSKTASDAEGQTKSTG